MLDMAELSLTRRELLADFHGDVLPPQVAAEVQRMVRADADAGRYVADLIEIQSMLRGLGEGQEVLHAMPAAVAARLDRLLDTLARG